MPHYRIYLVTCMPITSIEQAREILERFTLTSEKQLDEETKKGTMALFDVQKSPASREKAKATFDALEPAEQEKRIRAAQKLQAFWRQKTNSDTLVAVNPKGYHRPEVIRMLHNETLIKKNINQTKRRTLLQALQHNDWKNAIFDDPAILEIALATFINGSITTYQMETILGFHEASVALTHEKRTLTTSPILQSNGEPSPAAKIFLFSNLDGIMYREFTLERRKSFTLLLQAMIE